MLILFSLSSSLLAAVTLEEVHGVHGYFVSSYAVCFIHGTTNLLVFEGLNFHIQNWTNIQYKHETKVPDPG